MKLVIAEKPSVAKSLSKVIGTNEHNDGYFSGGGYAVSWCFGHLAELAQAESYNESYGKWKYEDLPIIPDNWQYAVSEDKRRQFEIVSELMNKDDVTEVINACDAGREGELIFRTVYNLAGCDKPMKRLWISSMEDSAIRDGFNNLRPGREYDNLYNAALCRSKADWLVGINATRLFSVLYHRTLNVGRVISPTLAMIVQRESEINAFKSEPFYKVSLDFGSFKAESERYNNEETATSIAQTCNRDEAVVKSVERRKRSEKPPALYDLTTLQREANKSLGYTAQQTLDYLQSLYEKKLCTYPRTDSKFLTEDMKDTVSIIAAISAELLETTLPPNIDADRVCDNTKVSDHHAIVLTKSVKDIALSSLLAGEREILKLVARRTLCAVSEPYCYTETMAVISCGSKEFTAKDKFVTQLGWKMYLKAEQPDNNLTEITEGQILNTNYISVTEGKTTPPKHFTEDTILSAMEKAGEKDIPDEAERHGIGTPSTRAAVIEKLVSAGFVTRKKDKKFVSLIPNGIGVSLITILPEELQSPLLTAQWEQQLLMIEKGELTADEFMSAIENMVEMLVRDYKIIDGAEVLFPSGREVVGKCPRCGSDVTESKKGYFCEKHNCRFALWKDNRFLTSKRVGLTKIMVQKLLKDGRAYVSGIYSEKTGKKYDAYIVMTDDGTKTTFSLDFSKKE
ncbi:MAG TPA: DNA topoisomerase 3 [Candidatus Ornithomonoglobus merdipullorum]|uniref:DNA topoisomerase n=1 Tax=Candidatus Ornithomonoglobus merdipullorum TaxID=2840895 RepID=A0A9D1MBC7_9FIRM|nr:DNA topoisomerase 3 [Candidatus Ornithomonoglobus merdipullorum]